ncbi:hypothetical protein [Microbispora triticiradicis]|uniref:FtsK domain-containing protein n=2 Tax=Microbispora TaxID=2005 RepID=A0ABY3LPZ2_9ACTN|nr:MULTISPECIES: hypothetical protein [Microbispora]TLP66522.1 hypothetical protein FED44_03415 [Microbispora fusca]TYB47415.1 hypothetical protein FXF59_29815 [Microbispora tritici]
MATTKASARKAEARRADWSLAPRGPVSGTAQGALALAAVAVAGDLATVSPLWGGAVTAAGAVATVVRSAHLAHPPAGLLYRLGCWLGAGSWLTYTLTAGLWSQGAWVALGIGALTAGLLSPLGRPVSRRASGAGTGRALVLGRTARVGEEWERRVQRVCRVRVSVTDVREWPTRTGYDVHADLPGAGSTRAHLVTAADALAVDARLPQGCGVEIAPGAHRGAVVLRVATVNRLTQNIDYPADHRARSILDPIALGEYRDGSTAAVLLRESSALVTGQKGSGKTTTLHALTAGIGLCRDAIVWHIDLNGGGMSQAWLHPWLEGDSPRPAVDWAAATPGEALELAETALAIAKDRKKSTRALKIKANASLMPVSPELPEIVVIVDEGGEALAPTNRDARELREALEEIQRIGRNEAVNVIVSSLRATQDMISANVRKQSAVRVGMYVQDEEELAFLFGWNKGLSLADLPGKGCGFVQDGQAAPRPFRGYFMRPGDVVDAAHAVARNRPELDAAARQVAGQAYATRYGRMRAAFTDLDGEHQEELPARYAAPAPAAPVRPRLAAVPCGPDASAWPDLRDLVKPATPAPAAPSMARAADWPDLLPRQRQPEVVRAERVSAVAAAPASARPLPEILARALEAFEVAGDDRMHSAALAEALGTADALALAALLRPLGVTTLPRAFIRAGTEARGYALADLQAAAERVRSGELEVPDEVAKWPAA